jgi:putative tryptophan/tyrosine transport system substrate-binding protein
MRRREFIALLSTLAWSSMPASAQQSARIPRIGVLWHAVNEKEEAAFITQLRRGFTDIGYVEGKSLIFEHRYPAERPERFESLAAELVNLKVDVLVAISIPSALAAQRATSTIPIVFCPIPDPVGLKLVSSLARPGGNITGVSSMAFDLAAKRIQLFKEAVPTLTRVALLLNPDSPYDVWRAMDESRPAAEHLNLSIEPFEARSVDDLDRAFASIGDRRMSGVIVSQNALFFNQRRKLAEVALQHKLPTMVPADLFVEAGGLIAYGPDWPALFRKVGPYVDKILKGAKPAELPVEQPTECQLVLNLKTAKALGVEVASQVVSRADKVIE